MKWLVEMPNTPNSRLIVVIDAFTTAISATPRVGKTIVATVTTLEAALAGLLNSFATQLGRQYSVDMSLAGSDVKVALASLVAALNGKDDSLILPALKVAHATVLAFFNKMTANI